MDDNRVLSGAHQQHLMSQKLDQAFHSFIHDYYTYYYDSNYMSPIVHIILVLGCSLILFQRIYWLGT
jgi:hypothetical protein